MELYEKIKGDLYSVTLGEVLGENTHQKWGTREKIPPL